VSNRFAGTSAIVTGAASGLGEATARHLAQQGVAVVVVDRDVDRGGIVADEIGGAFAQADVTNPEQVIAAIEAAVATAPLRAVVNCAGILGQSRTIGRDGEFASAHDLELFRRIIDVNLVGTFNVARLAATAMSRNEPFDEGGERGVIVNTTSIAAFDGQIGQIAYSASKAGIAGATLPLARDLAVVGVRVNAIAPGLIETPIYGSGPEAEDFKAKLARDVLFPKRLGTPAEFASMAWELINNGYVNGEVIRVDAGIRLPPK
jgi:NAD(P)-dependent dehydrogenase (short-subunit alcohol dehydrogenase family)